VNPVGAPSDEYDSEAHALVSAFAELDEDQITTGIIVAVIGEVWRQSFDLGEADIEKRMPEIQNLAKMLLQSQESA